MGVQGNMLTFIHNYLKERYIKVKIGNTVSDKKITQAGVPQGGVLSATCFLIAINTIQGNIHKDIKSSLYADDLVIYHTSRNIRTSARIIQGTIKKLEKSAEDFGLAFSTTKTECVHFWRYKDGDADENYTPLKLYNKEIPKKDTHKFLGMTLDRGLNWIPHIESLKAEALRSLNILKVVSKTDYGPDRKTLMRLYWAISKSKLDYGSQIYSTAGTTTLRKLDTVHNQALRICTGAFRSSPQVSLQVEAGSPPLELQREEQSLRYILRLESIPEYRHNMNVLDDQYDFKYDRNKRHLLPIGYRARCLKNSLNFTPDPIQNPIPDNPPWILKTVNVCYEGVKSSKRNTSTSQTLQNFLSHMQKHSQSKYIFTDGSKSHEGVGFGLVYGQHLENRIKGTLPTEASIFTAELQAIIRALTVIENLPHLRWTIFSDSQSSLQALVHLNPKNPLVQKIHTALIKLQNQHKTICFCKVPSHVGVLGNEAADKTAIEAQRLPGFHTSQIPHRDYHPQTKKFTMTKWQSQWDQLRSNKLKEIKPHVKAWPTTPGGNRKNETRIARLRIGHTRLTHGYLMDRGRPPECAHCGHSPLTTKHFLVECQMTQPMRTRLNLPNDLEKLLGESCPVRTLIQYLTELQIFDSI